MDGLRVGGLAEDSKGKYKVRSTKYKVKANTAEEEQEKKKTNTDGILLVACTLSLVAVIVLNRRNRL